MFVCAVFIGPWSATGKPVLVLGPDQLKFDEIAQQIYHMYPRDILRDHYGAGRRAASTVINLVNNQSPCFVDFRVSSYHTMMSVSRCNSACVTSIWWYNSDGWQESLTIHDRLNVSAGVSRQPPYNRLQTSARPARIKAVHPHRSVWMELWRGQVFRPEQVCLEHAYAACRTFCVPLVNVGASSST